MGDDQLPDPPRQGSRAPWERTLSASTQPVDETGRRGSGAGSRRAPTEKKLWPFGKRSDKPDDAVSVSELVDKVRGSEPDPEARTETLPRIDDAPAEDVEPKIPPPPAQPVAVGAPALTRLAASKMRRRRRARTAGRTVVATLAALALVLTGVVWTYLRATDSAFAQIAALDENSTDVVDPVGQTGDETFLIVGTDSRAGKNGQVGAGTQDQFDGSTRSDTVMLVNIPANRQRVTAVSFPRDLDVSRPECQGWDNNAGQYTNETFPSAEGDKLNATYALGGPKCLVKVIQKISGLRIGHFIGMDFSGFESMVNEVGGVDVCTATPLIDGELGPVLPNPGRQKIDGKTALNYVRARNVESEGNGDYGRIKRQQRFLSSLLRSALSGRVLFDPGKLNGFINAFTRETFVEKVTTRDLVTLGRSLQNVDAGAVTFLTVPTAGTNEYGNEIPRPEDTRAIFRAIIDDDPLPGEERSHKDDVKSSETSSAKPSPSPSAPATPQPAPDPSAVTVQVSNASGVSGVAATTANSLGAYGFQIYSVGNYPSTSATTVVRYSAGHEADAATVASSIPGATTEATSGLGSIVEVVLGSDFGGTVREPSNAGAPLPPAGSSPASTRDTAPVLPPDLSVTNAADDSCD